MILQHRIKKCYGVNLRPQLLKPNNAIVFYTFCDFSGLQKANIGRNMLLLKLITIKVSYVLLAVFSPL